MDEWKGIRHSQPWKVLHPSPVNGLPTLVSVGKSSIRASDLSIDISFLGSSDGIEDVYV